MERLGEFFYWPHHSIGHVETIKDEDDKEITIRSLSSAPRVFYVENFCSKEEADYIISTARAKGHMAESKVVYMTDKDSALNASIRTSYNVFFGENNRYWLTEDPMFEKLRRRFVCCLFRL
jgi:hypothetical protein